MKLLQTLIFLIVACSMLGGCPDKSSIESPAQLDQTEDQQGSSTEQLVSPPTPSPPPVFSVKEYVSECTLLTRNQSLCHELGEDLQHTLKDNITDDSDDSDDIL
jgi:hypothetical protein